MPYLEETHAAGIGSSGILHRILSHKAAVQYMRLGVSYLQCYLKLCIIPFHPQMVDDADLRKAERMMWHLSKVEKTYKVGKQRNQRDLLIHQSLEGGRECMIAVQTFRDDPQVLQTFISEATTGRNEEKEAGGHPESSYHSARVCQGTLELVCQF